MVTLSRFHVRARSFNYRDHRRSPRRFITSRTRRNSAAIINIIITIIINIYIYYIRSFKYRRNDCRVGIETCKSTWRVVAFSCPIKKRPCVFLSYGAEDFNRLKELSYRLMLKGEEKGEDRSSVNRGILLYKIDACIVIGISYPSTISLLFKLNEKFLSQISE